MKEVLSLATFALGVLCFVAFVTTVEPTEISAIQAAPDYCRRDSSGMRGCELDERQIVGREFVGVSMAPSTQRSLTVENSNLVEGRDHVLRRAIYRTCGICPHEPFRSWRSSLKRPMRLKIKNSNS
jgi:hypothetical protein